MRILSVDPATKSLAISITDFNENWIKDVLELGAIHEARLASAAEFEKTRILHAWAMCIEYVIYNVLQLRNVGLFDLTPLKLFQGKTPLELRMQRLKGVANYIRGLGEPPDVVLIEYQMSANDKSRSIATALAYEFSPACGEFRSWPPALPQKTASEKAPIVHIVGPALKNTVFFGEDGRMQNFRKRYIDNYACNKAHSRYNFLKWITEHNCRSIIADIPKANIDDVADSFLMAYAWATKQNSLKTE